MRRHRKHKWEDPKRFRTEKAKKRTNRRRNPYIRRFGNLSRAASSSNFQRPNEVFKKIMIPATFSIWQNPNSALKIFKLVENSLRKGHKIELDMSRITDISEDAILYLISRIEFYRVKYPYQTVRGTFPINMRCRDFLIKSRFTEYVISEVKGPEDYSILPIKVGRTANPDVASEIISFVSTIFDLNSVTAERVYGSIIELQQNTQEHAYKEDNIEGKWWLIAIPNTENTIIHFTLLDNGYGIPSTVKRKYLEIIRKHIPLTNREIDSKLISSALKGDFRRSQTGKPYRGQGLPDLFDLTSLNQIDNLRVISNFGHVLTGPNNTFRELNSFKYKFEGTLISWDFTKSKEVT